MTMKSPEDLEILEGLDEPLDESPDEAPAEPSTDLETLETLDNDDDDDSEVPEDLDTLKTPDKPLDEARSGKSSANLWKQTDHSPALQIKTRRYKGSTSRLK